MKILHLNTLAGGGAAVAARRLSETLQRAGMDSRVCVESPVSGAPGFESLVWKGRGLAPALRAKLPGSQKPSAFRRRHRKWLDQKQVESINGDSSDWGKGLVQSIPPDTDIVHLHWVSGWLDYEKALPALTERFRVFWTCHDMHPLLGVTHFPEPEWPESRVGEAQRSGMPPVSRKVLRRKSRVLESIPRDRLTFIAPSRWMEREIRATPGLWDFGIDHVPNGLDCNRFSPGDAMAARARLGIRADRFLFLCVAEDLENPRKGVEALIEGLNKMDREVRNQCQVLALGSNPFVLSERSDIPVVSLGRVEEETVLADVYRASDCFVISSAMDNFPNTLVEAMACGLPAVGFEVGGIPELIRHEETGWLARPGDSRSLAERLSDAVSCDTERREMGGRARKLIETLCPDDQVARRMIDLYRVSIGS